MTESPLLIWRSASRTDRGKVREINEDAYLDLPELGLWAVADGMGGHEAGDLASQMIVDVLQDVGEPFDVKSFAGEVEKKLYEVHQRLREIAAQHYDNRTIGSTVAALLAYGSRCACIWVGDSRVYRQRSGTLVQLTRDHTLAEEYVEKGFMSPEEAAQNPSANVLTQAIGASDALNIGVRFEDITNDDICLLCSDGLYKELTDTEIAQILRGERSDFIATKLLDLALERGARDNVTVAVVRFTNVSV